MIKHKSDILLYNNEVYNELYNIKALIRAIMTSCKNNEFSGNYYDLSKKFKEKLSDERNEYLSLLEIALNKLDILINLNSLIENNISYLE